MTSARKRRACPTCWWRWLKEIEVGFPAASQTDFDFVREIIEHDAIPSGRASALIPGRRSPSSAPSRPSRARRPPWCTCTPTSTLQRRVVFVDRAGIRRIATDGAEESRWAEKHPDTDWRFEYSPESYTGTELEYAVEVCNAVSAVWQPTEQNSDGGESAGDGGDGHLSTCMPTPSSGMHGTLERRSAVVLSCIRTTTGALRCRSSCATWPAPTASRVPVRQRRAYRQRSPGHPGLEPVQPGIDLQIDFRHRRDPPHRRVLQPALGVLGEHLYGGDLVYTAFSACTRTRSRRADHLKRDAEAAGSRWTTSPGRCCTCRSTRRMSAAPTRPSISGSTRSPASAALLTS